MIQVPADFPGGGPVWLFSIVSSGAIVAVTTVKILLWLKPNGNGNGKQAHIHPADVNRITDKISDGFRDLRLELKGELQRVGDAQESLAAYAMGVIKTLETEVRIARTRETKE